MFVVGCLGLFLNHLKGFVIAAAAVVVGGAENVLTM